MGNIPEDVVRDMADIAPMLSVLGYDPYANPPNYGKPDDVVADNTLNIQKNSHVWEKKAKEMFNVAWDNGDTALDREPSETPTNTTWYVLTIRCYELNCAVVWSDFVFKYNIEVQLASYRNGQAFLLLKRDWLQGSLVFLLPAQFVFVLFVLSIIIGQYVPVPTYLNRLCVRFYSFVGTC